MNLDHLQATHFVQKLDWTLRDAKHDYDAVEVAVLPPFTDLRSVQTLVEADKLRLKYGAQDLSTHTFGPFTGEISGEFLAKLGCTYAVVGHSERREHQGESDQVVNDKVLAAFQHGLTPILCIGENLADPARGPSGPVRAGAAAARRCSTSGASTCRRSSSPTSRSGRSAPVRSRPPTTRSRCARRSATSSPTSPTTRSPTRPACIYGGSVKARNIAVAHGAGRRRRRPGRWGVDRPRGVQHDLPVPRPCRADTSPEP